MKNSTIMLTVILAMAFCESQIALAQRSAMYGQDVNGSFGPRSLGKPFYGYQTQGMFGTRSIGQSSMPQASGFTGYAPNGFVGSYYGSVGQPYASTVVSTAATPQAMTPENMQPANYAVQETAPNFLPGGNTMEGVGASDQGFDMMPGMETPALANFISPPRIRTRAGIALATPLRPFTLSSQLSNRLTQIARSKDMMTSKNIDVYLSNDVARLQGTVRTPSDRATLANVLSLEPGIRQIDNRLVVK